MKQVLITLQKITFLIGRIIPVDLIVFVLF